MLSLSALLATCLIAFGASAGGGYDPVPLISGHPLPSPSVTVKERGWTQEDIRAKEALFSDSVREQANTAAHEDYLNPQEKEFFYFINLARIAPQQFVQVFLTDYHHAPGYVAGYAFKERKKTLAQYMNTMEPLQPLVPDETLFGFAECFATKGGKLGAIGHDREGTDCTGMWDGIFAECVDYGVQESALFCVLELLIDAGRENEDTTHRRILLDVGHGTDQIGRYMGVAVRNHKRYKKNTVIDIWTEMTRQLYLQEAAKQ